MENILGRIYCWFESLYGQHLSEYLWGFDCQANDYIGANLYNFIGLITLAVSLIVVCAYYYWPLNHPRFSKWWSWGIMLLINGVINLFIGFSIVNSHLNGGKIPSCLALSEENDTVTELITQSSCWGFGVANLLVSLLFFFIFTLCLKWWSSNCKYSPF